MFCTHCGSKNADKAKFCLQCGQTINATATAKPPSMEFQPAKCGACGGQLQVPSDRDIVKCMYCGVDVVIREATKVAASPMNVNSWLTLGSAAQDSGNSQEAYHYFTKVLEVDPKNHVAWFGKGVAAGQLSTLADFRVNEMLVGLNNSIEFCPEDQKAQLKVRAGTQIDSIVDNYLGASLQHLSQYASVDNVWEDHVKRVYLSVPALETAYNLNPNDPFPPKTIVDSCGLLLAGYMYDNMYAGTFIGIKAHHVPQEYRSWAQTKVAEFTPKAKGLDSNYQPARFHQAKSCFVATATLGSPNDPTVTLLRQFRDTFMIDSVSGRMMVRCYECVGPYLARYISKRQRRRKVSLILIVRPLARIAKAIMRRGGRNK